MSFKNKKAAYSKKRDDPNGAVIVLPHYLLNSDAYKTLSGNAVRLLIDIAMQYNTRNNGSLLASIRFMREKRGWKSSSALKKALNELIEHELICKTVQGRLPNKASWFALCWATLDDIKGLDISVQSFPRGGYAHWKPSENTKLIRKMPLLNGLVNKKSVSNLSCLQ